MIRLFSQLTRACAGLGVFLLLGCGGGADSSGAIGGIGGTGIKGPVNGATVTAYAINNGVVGARVSTAATDAQGNFTLSIGSHSGPVMLQMSGGTYIDEATGTTMTMAPGDVMSAMLPSVAAGAMVSGIQVTPLTSMAQSMAQRMTGGMTDANIATANRAIGNYFMVGDILRMAPMNPLVSGAGATATQEMRNYGMTLAAMSQYAKNLGMTLPSGIVTAMMIDASDAIMDGRAAGSPIGMGGGMMSGSMMRPDAGTVGLATAMADFMNSGFNKSGLTAASMTALMQQMRNSDGRMH